MASHCFTYGSLMCEDILFAVTGSHYRSQPARLEGFRRAPVLGQPYPGIVPAANAQVDGMLYLDLPDEACARLDAFEGEEYSRERIQVQLTDGRTESAWVYVFKPEYAHLLGLGEWDFDRFMEKDKARFVALYLGTGQP